MGALCCNCCLDKNTRYINERMAMEERDFNRTNKLLFLGPGGSGKSTIFKQLQWLHGGGFSNEDALMLKEHIYCQIIQQMKLAIKHYIPNDLHPQNPPDNVNYSHTGTPSEQKDETNTDDDGGAASGVDSGGSGDTNEENNTNNTTNNETDPNNDSNDSNTTPLSLQTAMITVLNHNDVTVFNTEIAKSVQYIWKNCEQIKSVFQKFDIQNKVLDETTEYFWNSIDRVCEDDYIPNEADIINVRYRTTGVIQKRFAVKGAKFHIFDVGGQKSERKKWIKCFETVKAVIFVVSLACYNQMMYEDLTKNCMVDSLELFQDICNKNVFDQSQMILFLNKRDLFAKKIVDVSIKECPSFIDFDDFDHSPTIHSNPNDYEQAISYIRFKFQSLNKKEKKQIYCHITCAMDKTNIGHVFNDVKHIVITQNLMAEGLG